MFCERIVKGLNHYRKAVEEELNGAPMGDVDAMGAGFENDGPVDMAEGTGAEDGRA